MLSWLEEELAELDAAGLRRRCRVMEGATGPVSGRLTVMASNDYLDLARDPRVVAAAAEAALKWGAGSGGSRLLTGTQPPHVSLERRIAEFKRADAAVVFGAGYMANVGTMQALAGKGDTILSDALNHASIIDGCRLSGARIVVYRHCDMADLDEKMAECSHGPGRLFAVSDGVFSMDGDLLPLPEFLDVCRRHGAVSIVDEAHATGVVGATGRGLPEHFGCGHPDVTVGTLSKALGSSGGFVCGSSALAEFLRNKARSFIFSTACGAPTAAAAEKAIEILDAEPERVVKLRRNASFFVASLARRGLRTATESAIVPIVVGDERAAMAASEELREKGFLIPAVRYPSVAHGSARLRVALMSAHGEGELDRAADAIADAMPR